MADNSVEHVYSMPGVVVFPGTSSLGYSVYGVALFNPFRLIGSPNATRYPIGLANTIPFSLGGDLVEKVYRQVIGGDDRRMEQLLEAIRNALFTGGFAIGVASSKGVRTVALFFPSNKLVYYIVDRREAGDCSYSLEELVLLGLFLEEPDYTSLLSFCRKIGGCRVLGECLEFCVWRKRSLVVSSRELASANRALRIYPDNTPFRHAVIV